MSAIAIVTDSCASIPEDLITTLNIHWVPYYIHYKNQVWKDLVTIKRQEFYEWLPNTDELPKTASPGPGDYLELYTNLAEKQGVEEIASIHMTSKGSGAYQAALAARAMAQELLPRLKIEVIDTLNVSMCHGWMVIEAARAALAGKSLFELVELVKRMIPVTRMIQTADTLKYLHMGGRIGRARHLLGSLLNIKPLIGMDDGVIVALGQVRSRNKAYAAIVELIENALAKLPAESSSGKIKIAYVHAAAPAAAEHLRELVESRLPIAESLMCELTPALGVHTGPGTVGVCYYPAPA